MSQSLTLTSNSLAQGGMVQIETSNRVPGTLQLQAAASALHLVQLADARSDAGVPLTATPTGGAMGVTRTAGTSLTLLGEVTSSNAKTDKATWFVTMPATYVPASNFTVSVNASVTGSGTLTGASTTITCNVYTEVAGVETLLTVTAAQQMVPAGSTLVFTVTGTGVTNGSQLAIELVMLVTSASGANTGTINSVGFTA